MKLKTMQDMEKCIFNNLYKIPKSVDLIVGIPRSGMLAATLISLYLNLPLIDSDSIMYSEKTYSSGMRLDYKNIDIKNCKHLLVVDDSILTGKQLRKIKESFQYFNKEITYLAIYGLPNKVNNFYFEELPLPRCFSWNIFHHLKHLSKVCMDIDGVLCLDPTSEQNDDGEKYKEFITNAKVLIKPQVAINNLVTCRLEKYRGLTEKWLSENNILYNNLYMMNVPDKITRQKLGEYGKFKARIYQEVDDILFIESNIKQAVEIHNLTKKAVFCISNYSFYS
jgi:uncharacterized HAD superfamily protein